MKLGNFTITQASLISAFTFVVGQLVAFVPSLGTDKQNLLSAGSTIIAVGFLIANAVHAHGSAKTAASVTDPKADETVTAALAQAQAEVQRQFNELVATLPQPPVAPPPDLAPVPAPASAPAPVETAAPPPAA